MGLFATLLIAVGNPGTAVAQQISGTIGFTGSGKAANDSFASVTLGAATAIDFNGNGIQDTGIGQVASATGDFAFTLNSTVTLWDFIFNPLAAGGVNPLWSVYGFTFALTSIQIVTQNDNLLSLLGTGTASGNGFAATAGTWSFSAMPDTNFFNFAASVTAVPEPEIYAMMGIGLGLIGWIARRKKSKEGAAA